MLQVDLKWSGFIYLIKQPYILILRHYILKAAIKRTSICNTSHKFPILHLTFNQVKIWLYQNLRLQKRLATLSHRGHYIFISSEFFELIMLFLTFLKLTSPAFSRMP